jgi:alkylhydroperoxidase family enzyme
VLTAWICIARTRAVGETEQRLYALNAWRETPFFSERAALEWTESLTLVSETHVPDETFEVVKKQFSEKEIADLTIIVGMINLWNRVAISARTKVGDYQSKYATSKS